MDEDELCNEYGNWATVDMVMRDWERTVSPTSYWFDEMSDSNYRDRWFKLQLDDSTVNSYSNLSYGLPTGEALNLCKWIYRNSIAKLTVQIADPEVVQLKKDIRISFADQLGVVGEKDC